MARALGKDQPLWGFEASGLESGETLALSVEQAAEEYVQAIRTVQAEGPYQLLGMSFGGVIAYEMARQIREEGAEVIFLALLDTTVPGSRDAGFTQAHFMRAMAAELGCADLIDQMSQPLTLEQLVEHGLTAGRLPVGFTLGEAERVAEVLRNAMRIESEYQLKRWEGPLLLLRATQREGGRDAVPDWSPFASRVEIVDVECNHYELVTTALAPAVAAAIASRLG